MTKFVFAFLFIALSFQTFAHHSEKNIVEQCKELKSILKYPIGWSLEYLVVDESHDLPTDEFDKVMQRWETAAKIYLVVCPEILGTHSGIGLKPKKQYPIFKAK